ncbi:BtrH N-terminal domain-containing protein, partial [bacterium]|nr:BtrH N-terminal domain-containing protein [bacterium]
MRKMVSGFTHRVGVHCATTAFRNLFAYEGHYFSEDMCFGLGSGLGFTYWKDKRMPFPFV